MDPAKPANVTIYRGSPSGNHHVWSPFVVKLEARFRFAGVPYTTGASSYQTAPKWDISNPDAENFRDSGLMAKGLVEGGVLPDINARLAPETKTHDLALRALLEDRLYFYHMWERWTQNYYAMRDHVLWSLPQPMRVLAGLLVYRSIMAKLHGQVTWRYSAGQVAGFRDEIWESINGLLVKAKKDVRDDGPFWALGGTEPTEADTALFGFIVSILICSACPDSKKVVGGYPVVIEYASRIHDRYFPDYEKWE